MHTHTHTHGVTVWGRGERTAVYAPTREASRGAGPATMALRRQPPEPGENRALTLKPVLLCNGSPGEWIRHSLLFTIREMQIKAMQRCRLSPIILPKTAELVGHTTHTSAARDAHAQPVRLQMVQSLQRGTWQHLATLNHMAVCLSFSKSQHRKLSQGGTWAIETLWTRSGYSVRRCL